MPDVVRDCWKMSRSSIDPESHGIYKIPTEADSKTSLPPALLDVGRAPFVSSVHLSHIRLGTTLRLTRDFIRMRTFHTLPEPAASPPPYRVTVAMRDKGYYHFLFPGRTPRIREIERLVGRRTGTNRGAEIRVQVLSGAETRSSWKGGVRLRV